MGYLRLLFAFAVVQSHSSAGPLPVILTGAFAVECFFIISGFCIQLIMGSYASSGPGWVRRFYGSRLLRLMPLYYLVLLAYFLLQADVGAYRQIMHSGREDTIFIYLFVNLFLLGQDILRFVPFDYQANYFFLTANLADYKGSPAIAIMGQAWSLSLELMFYMLAPFLLRCRWQVLAGVAIVSLGIKIWVARYALLNQNWEYVFFPAELCFFLFGALACRVALSLRARYYGMLAYAAALAAISAVTVAFTYIDLPLNWRFAGYVTLLLIALPLIFQISRSNRFDRWLGDFSYPVYIMHLLVIQLLARNGVGPEYMPLVTLAVCMAAAYPFLLFIDRPLTRFRHRKLRKTAGKLGFGRATVAFGSVRR